MIIGIDASRTAAGQLTGTEGYALHLIGALIDRLEESATPVCLRLYLNQPPRSNLFPASDRVEYVVIPFPRLWTHWRLGWELQQRPPDVFFTPAHVIPLMFRGRSVATVHDLGYHYFPEAHTRFQVAYLKWSTRHNVRRARHVLADSQATKADLARFYGVPPEKVSVVYPGLPPGLGPVKDTRERAAVQRKYGITPPYLLYLGTLQPRKNLVRLVEAYAALPDHIQQLVLAGKPGWLSQSILDRISNLQSPISNRIRLTGYVAEEDKAALISGAMALLFPSLYEGFGFPVLEGQACGTPVVCANMSSLPEVAGEGALLVDPLSTAGLTAGIERIIQDQALRARLIEKGLVNVKRFTWEKAAEQVLAILRAVAEA